jgi:hypothetical protein
LCCNNTKITTIGISQCICIICTTIINIIIANITAAIAGHESDSIAAVTVLPSPAGAGHLQVGDIAADGRVAVVWLSGGQAGTTYRLQITVATTSGRVLGRAVSLPVLPLAAQAPPSGALQTPGGAIITDEDGNPILIGG